MDMDWFSWLSKTGLEPTLVYEYGLAFAHNELEEDDIADFNHDFLQSMGISIAKHRLEILKLAKKEKGVVRRPPISRLVTMIKKIQKCIVKYVRVWACRNSSAIMTVPRKAYGKRWRGAMLRRNKRMMILKQRRLMITDGSPIVGPTAASVVSPIVYDLRYDVNDGEVARSVHGSEKDGDEAGWSNRIEEVRWASMFHDLKPT
ncbi:uncharacterized protein LOC131256175 [Magnolia sinica]|uniref:uncharacterized protein LOC131256175 n=1 Tax=Magnolia sinica TaxID=86752 RepID=UPI0026586042|nr:uncharacterized protein LOC131256175 [Magnolia sinica]